MKTLVVDDDATNVKVLKGMLNRYGETHTAFNGQEALDAIFKAYSDGEPFNLVCLDIMMPEMDGQTVLKAVRAKEAELGIAVSEGVKIIMASALDDKENILGAFKEGCEGYIIKPISREKLIQKVKDLGLIS